MKNINIEICIQVFNYHELNEQDRKLIDAAKEATQKSYAPYSHFYVGAAVLLDNGLIITGNNQENVAYPSGLCAERTALFYANAQHPNQAVTALAIAARNSEGFLNAPIPPCGSCRQVMMETEQRFNQPIRILLFSETEIYAVNSTKDLLPLSFGKEFLE